MVKDKPVEVTPRTTPLAAGEPVEADALSQMGSTFAERAAASKAVQEAENKSVQPRKTTSKRK